LIITEKDIAYKKSAVFPEWGIFGLGLRPGKTSVISTFRLKKRVTSIKMLVRLKKVTLHEIGHNLGLEHCTNNHECMMNDADGTIQQVDRERIWFCEKCWEILKN
jgi:archaemetzincin